jgi:uncharacterized membrane protein YiaA
MMNTAQIIQCPGCREYISSDAPACRFCQRPVDQQTRQTAAAAREVENRSEHKKQSFKNMLLGLGLMIVGIAVTAGTYAAAASSRGGGRYVVTWGLIIFGGLRFFKGLMGWAGDN